MNFKKQIITLITPALLFLPACSDNDEPEIPGNAITLNMMNDDNGETSIGNSDVHINSSNNFISSYCDIVDLGRKGNFNQNPDLTQIARQMAVTPGNYYQIVLSGDIHNVAGQRAFPLSGYFYNVYVDSWLYNSDNSICGAKVQYAECTPSTNKLPEWDTTFSLYLKADKYTETVSYSFNAEAKIDSDYDIYDLNDSDLRRVIDIKIMDNKITFTNSAYTPGGKVEVVLKVRFASIYSRVRFIISSSIK